MRLFKRKSKEKQLSESELYAKMGSLGVSPRYMELYLESANKIKDQENIYNKSN
ncbi:hypothetical protein JOC34_000518 [Virgibacillus halotolerans]|uniref:hypothetical protein n=1 Tax=Virgibacillus halotolerans TaxID=1071053 RepID=UPI0019608996|nr:hypothetical protein [Virgibacillus halotolerans]MBM7598161.1 hypothetical protein [Virgibacillus halotolerans]